MLMSIFMPFIFISCDTSSQDTAQELSTELSTVVIEEKLEENIFSSAKECGACHPSQYTEWRESMHAYAIHSPVFQAMAQKAFRDSSGEVGDFCTSCHSPMGALIGEGPNISPEQRSDIGNDSVTCETCHSSVGHHYPTGNLSLIWNTEGILTGPFNDVEQDSHVSEQSDFLTSPELCGSCHDVFNYPAIRIEEAFSEYTQSPAYLENTTCQDCHMSQTPGVPSEKPLSPIAEISGMPPYPARPISSHRFVGPDYSLLDHFPYPDDLEKSARVQAEQFERTEELLRNSIMISDISVISNSTPNSNTTSEEGTEHHFSVTLQSLTAGHNVPTGFTSERQLWIEVSVYSENTLLFSSGMLDSNEDLRDEHSWDVISGIQTQDEQLVNLQSKNIMRYNGEIEHSKTKDTLFPFDADYIYKRSIPPLESRTFQYYFLASASPTRIEAKLRYRNLPPYILRALQLHELTPKLKIVDIDTMDILWDSL